MKKTANNKPGGGKSQPGFYPEKIWVLAMTIFIISLADLKAGNGSGKTGKRYSFSITDPRNPDCPCHLYQRQADQEYEQLKRQTGMRLHPPADSGALPAGMEKNERWLKFMRPNRFYSGNGEGRKKRRLKSHMGTGRDACFRWS